MQFYMPVYWEALWKVCFLVIHDCWHPNTCSNSFFVIITCGLGLFIPPINCWFIYWLKYEAYSCCAHLRVIALSTFISIDDNEFSLVSNLFLDHTIRLCQSVSGLDLMCHNKWYFHSLRHHVGIRRNTPNWSRALCGSFVLRHAVSTVCLSSWKSVGAAMHTCSVE